MTYGCYSSDNNFIQCIFTINNVPFLLPSILLHCRNYVSIEPFLLNSGI
jgi:hypothetical protein